MKTFAIVITILVHTSLPGFATAGPQLVDPREDPRDFQGNWVNDDPTPRA